MEPDLGTAGRSGHLVGQRAYETLGVLALELGKGCNNGSDNNKKSKIIAATRKEE